MISLFASAYDFLYFKKAIFLHNLCAAKLFFPFSDNKNDLIYKVGLLECLQGIRKYRLFTQLQILLMNFCSHSLSAACRKHDCCTIYFRHSSTPFRFHNLTFIFSVYDILRL